MMNRMIVSNLVHRPLRSVISIVAIAVEVSLILLIVGLSMGILNDSAQRTLGVGADLMIMPPGSSWLQGLGGAPAPIGIADKVAALPHVQAVSPVVAQLNTAGTLEVIYGIDLASFEKMGGPFRYLSGGPLQGPNDVLVDDYFADLKKVHVGDRIEIFNQEFRVAGIVLHGKGARKFVPITTLQDLTGSKNKASIFYVKVEDPKDIESVKQAILAIPGMQQYHVRSMPEYLSLMTVRNTPGLSTFIDIVIGVAVVIGFIVIFQAMYTAVMERTREIGILKSMGASKLYIVNVILRETILLAVAGILLGTAASFLARAGLLARFPTTRVEITGDWVLRATLIAITGAILGAIYPALRAAQKDPIDALAYE
ncbi:MAG TPA: ABC transporter permease [Terriglobales bacterium]|nr:ABC transporter permease [Terriglobales bacterium]